MTDRRRDAPEDPDKPAAPLSDSEIAGLLDRIDTALWIFDVDRSRVLWANAAGRRIWKAQSLDELRGRDLAADMSPMVARRLRHIQQDLADKGESLSEAWTLYPNDEPETMTVIAHGLALPDERVAILAETHREAPAPNTLRSIDALMHTSVMISLYDLQGARLYANPAARDATPADASRLGDRFEDATAFDALMETVGMSGAATETLRVQTPAGPRWHKITAHRSKDAATGKTALLLSEHDVSDLVESERQIRRIAAKDALTGLPNRYSVQMRFPGLLAAAAEAGESLGVYLLDLDRFKVINDTLGHSAGDQLLVAVGRRLESLLRGGDMVARLGGDEFLYCRIEAVGAERSFTQSLLGAFAEPFSLCGKQYSITPSVGVSRSSSENVGLDELLKRADIALYEVKETGRNGVAAFTPALGAKRDARMRLELDLEKALERDEFFLVLQPKVCAGTGAIRAAEALLRWRHPVRGLVSPAVFVPVCEETGLIREVGRWVMDACARTRRRLDALGHSVKLSFNVSPIEFTDPGFMASALSIENRTGCAPDRLEIEVTETALFADEEATGELLGTLRQAGYAIAIDDFGAGYSNLARLASYPITTLKLDRSLVKAPARTAPLIGLAAALGRTIGATTIAEGVETEEQLAAVRAAGCDQYQGFLFSRPVELDALLWMLEDERRNGPGVEQGCDDPIAKSRSAEL